MTSRGEPIVENHEEKGEASQPDCHWVDNWPATVLFAPTAPVNGVAITTITANAIVHFTRRELTIGDPWLDPNASQRTKTMSIATLMTLAGAVSRLTVRSTSERKFCVHGMNGKPLARSQESPT